MSKNVLHTILGCVLSVVLCVIIFLEAKYGFAMVYSTLLTDANDLASIAKREANVTVNTIVTYAEIPEVPDDGEVLRIPDTDIYIKVSGRLSDDKSNSVGTYNYVGPDDTSKTLHIEERTAALDEFRQAVITYWNGTDDQAILGIGGITYQRENITFYQQTYVLGNIPVIYNSSTELYYMFIDNDNSFFIVSAPDPMNVTREKPTIHYSNPSADPMYSHVYSKYEELAAKNTLNELTDKDGNKDKDDAAEDGSDNPYESGGVVGTADTYTSSSDNNKRKSLAGCADHKWKPDGTSDTTSATIDITSADAKASEWKLTSTVYSYTHAGLTISNLSGKRDAASFELNGNINNTLDAERPYVIVIKFIAEDNSLLGIKVLDCRTNKLAAKGVATFAATVTKSGDGIDIEKIVGVQFDVY